ncbi:MAG TPA: response regulator [Nitrospira sp.]|jgi:PAS domain S-box-containing protein|nr:response regulator [Nitrospira sp.]
MTEILAKILLVDDDARSLMAMETLLTGHGRTVITADSGQEALRQVLRHDFAVILLDVRMPRVDGFEAAELIRQREQSRHTPIIFLSAVDKLDDDVFRGLASGAVDYLFKPVVPEVLQSKVSVFVELYRMRERVKLQAVRQGEERFSLLVDSIRDYSILLLSPEGIVTSWNPGVRLVEGYEASEIIGRNHAEFFTADDTERGSPGQALEMATSAGQHEDEGWRVRKDGSKFWANVVITAMKDDAGKLSGFARVARDLTERKAAEEQLRKIAVELEQRVSERTQELRDSQLRLRDLAMELTLTEQRERRRLAGELHDYLAQLLVLIRIKIRQTSSHVKDATPTALLMEADRAIIDSLNYTRSLVAELAPPALQEFGLLEGFGWLAEQMQNHGLTVTVKKNVQHIVLDDDQAVLVFQSTRELLFNVLKHASTTQAEVSIDTDDDGHLIVTVKDEGCGFNFDEVTGNREERKRFGLFSVRERTEAMGGRLVVTSVLRKGTSAALIIPYWPVVRDATPQPGSLTPGAASLMGKESHSRLLAPLGEGMASEGLSGSDKVLRVLLADDHAMVRQGLRSILESYRDISVVGEAADGEEAVEMAERLAPDVIVMDVNMAKLDGIEATRRVKARWPGIRVVGLSVSTRAQVESLLLEAGASCYVSKEAAGDQLYGAIGMAVQPTSRDWEGMKRVNVSQTHQPPV